MQLSLHNVRFVHRSTTLIRLSYVAHFGVSVSRLKFPWQETDRRNSVGSNIILDRSVNLCEAEPIGRRRPTLI